MYMHTHMHDMELPQINDDAPDRDGGVKPFSLHPAAMIADVGAGAAEVSRRIYAVYSPITCVYNPVVLWAVPMKTSTDTLVDSSPPRAAYTCQWTRSALIEVMTYCLFDWTNAGSLSIGFPETNFSKIWIGILSCSFNRQLKMSSARMVAILSRGDD